MKFAFVWRGWAENFTIHVRSMCVQRVEHFPNSFSLFSCPVSLCETQFHHSLKISKAIFRGDPCNAMWSRLISDKRIYLETEFHPAEYSWIEGTEVRERERKREGERSNVVSLTRPTNPPPHLYEIQFYFLLSYRHTLPASRNFRNAHFSPHSRRSILSRPLQRRNIHLRRQRSAIK